MKKHYNIRNLAILSVLMSFAVMLKINSFTTATLRISLFAIPIIIAGIIGGIPLGILVGAFSDIIYGLFFSPFPFNPCFTISSIYWGITGGLIGIIYNKKNKICLWQYIVIILITSLLETHTNVLMTYLVYGTGTAFYDLIKKYITLIIKLPIIIGCIKLLNDRIIIKYLNNKNHNTEQNGVNSSYGKDDYDSLLNIQKGEKNE